VFRKFMSAGGNPGKRFAEAWVRNLLGLDGELNDHRLSDLLGHGVRGTSRGGRSGVACLGPSLLGSRVAVAALSDATPNTSPHALAYDSTD